MKIIIVLLFFSLRPQLKRNGCKTNTVLCPFVLLSFKRICLFYLRRSENDASFVNIGNFPRISITLKEIFVKMIRSLRLSRGKENKGPQKAIGYLLFLRNKRNGCGTEILTEFFTMVFCYKASTRRCLMEIFSE